MYIRSPDFSKNCMHALAAPGFWFGGGGARGNGSEGANAGGPGAKAPRTVVKFHFLKRFKVLENDSIFQKYNIFLARKSIFSKEKFLKSDIFHKNF